MRTLWHPFDFFPLVGCSAVAAYINDNHATSQLLNDQSVTVA